jgi:hypothetical protein
MESSVFFKSLKVYKFKPIKEILDSDEESMELKTSINDPFITSYE